MVGIKELVERLAKERGISKVEARSILDDVFSLMHDSLVATDGISLKGYFTIKKKLRKGRSGIIDGKKWETKDKYVLTIKAGHKVDFHMNYKDGE